MNNTLKKAAVSAAVMTLLSGCAKDTNGFSAVYDGDGWSLRTETGVMTLTIDDDGRGDWDVSDMSRGVSVDSDITDGADTYTITVKKKGDGIVTFDRQITRDNAPYLQTMSVRYTADSNRKFYDCDVTVDTANYVINAAPNEQDEPAQPELEPQASASAASDAEASAAPAASASPAAEE